jgi:DNA-binding transcriptional LysR family regulator
MNLRHIDIFHSVYVSGSISGAARILNVSQPSVTKTLRHAEQLLGFPLFLRNSGKLIPTEEAHALFNDVADIQARVMALKHASKNMRRGIGVTLRISALPSLGLKLLPQSVAEFMRATPGVFFDLQTVHHDEIARRLYERETDLVIAFEVPKGLPVTTRWLGEGELGLLYREAEVPDAPARIPLEMVADRDFISVAHSGPIGELLRGELGRMELDLTEVASARTFYIASALVREGVGMTIVDNFTAQAAIGEGVSFRPLRPSLTFDVHAIALENRPPSQLAGEFLDLMVAKMDELA